ncbi:MAG TPA: hypothetical protein VK453_24470 [Micromonosporaceae bacterium]|nr:hypothetical protein [Micromonosporaceae bacterium]
MTATFTAPAAGDILQPKDIVGHLLIVRPTEHATGISTTFGEKDGIRADVCVLTELDPTTQQPGRVYQSVLWLQGKLVGSLKKSIGDLVLARMSVGTGKPGQQPPFELDDATGDQAAVNAAQTWLDAHPGFVNTATAAPAAAGTPTPAQPVPPPAPTTQPVPLPAAATQPIALPNIPPAPIGAPPAPIAVAAPPVPIAVAAPPVPAPVAAAPTPAIDPAILAQLTPEALQQFLAIQAQTQRTA